MTSLLSLATHHECKGRNARDLDEVSSGLARMIILNITYWRSPVGTRGLHLVMEGETSGT